jgi:ribosomal protein S18 acetylase RimI-like enzyme
MLFFMDEPRYPATIEIRPAVPGDADSIARTFLESAEYHAELDPERYSTPAVEMISSRYREDLQHPSHAGREVTILVAELGSEIVGFIDARLEQSPDPMHREMIYCHIAEIAVRCGHRNQGIGGRLLRRLKTGGTGWVRSSRHWNITPQTRAPACSIRSAWAIAWQPSQP